MSEPDNQILHRQNGSTNAISLPGTETGIFQGCQDTGSTPNGRENANTEAAQPAAGGDLGSRGHLLAMAEAWRRGGCLVHPATADGSKTPLVVDGGSENVHPDVYPDHYEGGPRHGMPHPLAGKPHRQAGKHKRGWKRVASGDRVVAWPWVRGQLRGPVDGIGIFTGSPSGGVEMVELEGAVVHMLPRLEATAERMGVADLWRRLEDGCSEWSPRHGLHWFLRVVDGAPLGNTKLAMRISATTGKPEVMAETRGQGGWVVVAGSFGRTHNSGRPYAMRSGSPETIPTFTAEERDKLYAVFRSLDELPEHTRPATPNTAPVPRAPRPDGSVSAGDDFNERGTWLDVLPTGWAMLSRGGKADAYSMHGRGGRKTADLYHESDTLFIYDTDCPGSQRKLSKFAAFAWLRHNGDFRAAARELYAAGYGTKNDATETPAPPARIEVATTTTTVDIATLRDAVADQLSLAATGGHELVVITAGMGASKTSTAARVLPELVDGLTHSVATHDAATQALAFYRAAGHHDAEVCPPRDASTCENYTDADADKLKASYGGDLPLSMERAMKVGMPMLACFSCPLFKADGAATIATPDDAFSDWSAADDDELYDAFTEGEWVSNNGREANATKTPPPASDTAGCRCEYWRRQKAFKAARIRVQCQERTRRNPGELAPTLHERSRVLLTDENAIGVLNHKIQLLPVEFDKVATALQNAMNAEAPRYHEALGRRKVSPAAAKRADDIRDTLQWAAINLHVANHVASTMRAAEEENAHGSRKLPEPPEMPPAKGIWGEAEKQLRELPDNATKRLARLMARAELPAGEEFADALALVRKLAADWLATRQPATTALPEVDSGWEWRTLNVRLLVTASVVDGVGHATVVWRQALKLPAGVRHIVLDGTADLAGLKATHPDALVLAPPGEVARAVHAEQWPIEISPKSSPATLLDWIERALEARPHWRRTRLFVPKRHRELLWPITRSRKGAAGVAKPIDIARLAAWGGRPSNPEAWQRRQDAARKLAQRVEAINARLAKDANGTPLVEHLRGAAAKGSNAVVDGNADSLLIVGHVRVRPEHVAAHLVATGREDAVNAGNGGWGWCEYRQTDKGGRTRSMRYRGYGNPAWADAAEACNRADLQQVVERGRTRLADCGVETLLVAGEPTGLDLATPPERLPDGIRAVVAAVATLTGRAEAGKMGSHQAGEGATDGHGNRLAEAGSVQPRNAQNPANEGGESCQRPMGHTPVPILIGRWHDSQQAALIEIGRLVRVPERTLKRWLTEAVDGGHLVRHGAGRGTRYTLPSPAPAAEVEPTTPATTLATSTLDATPLVPDGNDLGSPLPVLGSTPPRAPEITHSPYVCHITPHPPTPTGGVVVASMTPAAAGVKTEVSDGFESVSPKGVVEVERGAGCPPQKRVAGSQGGRREVASGNDAAEPGSGHVGDFTRDATTVGERGEDLAGREDGRYPAEPREVPPIRRRTAPSGEARRATTGPLETLPANARRDALRVAIAEHTATYGPVAGPADELARSIELTRLLVGATGPPA